MGRQRTKAETNKAVPKGTLDAIIAGVEYQMAQFTEAENVDSGMTGRERLRLFGAGVKNYGFINKAWDIARDNPQFLPPFLERERLGEDIRALEQVRQLDLALEQFKGAVGKCLLVRSDNCYREALRVYSSLKEQSRNKVPGAQVLYDALKVFFSRRKRLDESGPTEKELKRDVKRLLRGKADGEVVIKNEAPHAQGGVHEIIDSVHKGRGAFKETAKGQDSEKR